MKRKKLKKVLCMAAAPVFCLSLFSCNNKKEGAASVQSQKEQSVQTNENSEQIIGFALVGCLEDEFSPIVNDFNKKHEGKYRAVMRQIQNTEQSKDFSNALNMEIVSGNAPDIICVMDYSLLRNLAGKGAVANLYPLIDSENSPLAREDFLSNYLTANEIDGKLIAMPVRFSISTAVAKKKNVPGVSENWTPDEMVQALENMPEETLLSVGSTEPTVNLHTFTFRSSSRYIDYNTGECTFNGEEFTNLIELSKELSERGDDTYQEDANVFAADKALVYFGGIHNEDNFESMKTDTFGDDELIFVGNPSYDGKGGGFAYTESFGIMETSDCKEGAWLLIEEYLGDKYFESRPDGFSPLEKNLNIEDEYLDSYIRSLTDNNFYDYDVMDIIKEEAAYYYSGERTAQECTEIINNRISIKIAEQTWQT